MKPAPFDYHAPESTREAVQLLGELGDDAKVLAGGQSLIPMLALRLARFEHLVDVHRIQELAGIRRTGDTVTIGAATTEAVIGRSPEIRAAAPLLARATPLIGHFQIRNRGTIGGSLAHADPAAEYPAVALALDATFESVSPRGRRTTAAHRFFTGLWSTALDADELLVGIRIPVWTGRCGFAVQEFSRRHGDFAIAGAAVAVAVDADDRVERCAIALIGMNSTAVRATEAERALMGSTGELPDDVGRLAVAGLSDVPADLNGSAAYRRRVGAAMVGRAWSDAVQEARRG